MTSPVKTEPDLDVATPGDSNHSVSPAASTLATSMSSTSSTHGGESQANITCRWKDCTSTYEDPEQLYVHLCNDHVGRKSTNNLCLTCQWEGCSVSCAKRDHITSHLRVHTPLKPHACDSCGKLFKRPQDLKKHERIHTEQHQQVRQARFKHEAESALPRHYPHPHQSVNAGWAGSHMPPTASMTPYYSGQSRMYPGLPDSLREMQSTYVSPYAHQAASSYNSQQIMAGRRDLTPVSSSSNSSVSPLSSHLATPASGSSPASMSQYGQGHSHYDRGYLSMISNQNRGHHDSEPNSYLSLAQGSSSSSLAGSKRGHEAVATASFFEDVRRKRIMPSYDPAMAERLEDTFAPGIDDASLQALLNSFTPGVGSLTSASVSGPSGHNPEQHDAAHSRLSLPEAFKQTDLAELNAFLLQVGANAARDSSVSGDSTSSSGGEAFDFIGTLNSYGLDNIPGFDESLLQWPAQGGDERHQVPSHPHGDGQWSSQAQQQRPIAHLPQRSAAFGYPALPAASTYSTPSMHSGSHGPMMTSFDSIRASRGPSYVPQLAAKEGGASIYRHVEALTRAEPMPRSDRAMLQMRSPESRKDMLEDEEMEDGTSSAHSPSVRSASPASTATPSSVQHRSPSERSMSPRISVRREDSMDGIEQDVAAMEVRSSSIPLGHVPASVRQRHAMLLLKLLRAINYPRKSREARHSIRDDEDESESMRLPPIRSELSQEKESAPAQQPAAEGSDDSHGSRSSTPKIESARRQPNIASLLN